jgi:hypothetical protein
MARTADRRTEDARRHHYVPRFLLKNFSVSRRPGRHQIYVFDKARSRQFITSVNIIAVELDYSAIEEGQYRLSFESGMAQIESDTAGCIRKIIDTQSLAPLTNDERARLCVCSRRCSFFEGLTSERDFTIWRCNCVTSFANILLRRLISLKGYQLRKSRRFSHYA